MGALQSANVVSFHWLKVQEVKSKVEGIMISTYSHDGQKEFPTWKF